MKQLIILFLKYLLSLLEPTDNENKIKLVPNGYYWQYLDLFLPNGTVLKMGGNSLKYLIGKKAIIINGLIYCDGKSFRSPHEWMSNISNSNLNTCDCIEIKYPNYEVFMPVRKASENRHYHHTDEMLCNAVGRT